MKDAYATFQRKEMLQQSVHTYSMQLNKGMNLAIAKYAPKLNRTLSLLNQVSVAMGVKNTGH
eukprot:2987531-Ditylum_brightwellii.AAC.1